jgi:hypothetical protein
MALGAINTVFEPDEMVGVYKKIRKAMRAR